MGIHPDQDRSSWLTVKADGLGWQSWPTLLTDSLEWQSWLTVLTDSLDWQSWSWLTVFPDGLGWRSWLTVLTDNLGWQSVGNVLWDSGVTMSLKRHQTMLWWCKRSIVLIAYSLFWTEISTLSRIEFCAFTALFFGDKLKNFTRRLDTLCWLLRPTVKTDPKSGEWR